MDPLYQVAADFFMDENYDQALLTYDLLIKKSLKDGAYDKEVLAEVHFKRGLTHYKLDSIELALKDTTDCIDILEKANKTSNPFYGKAFFRKGLYHFKLNAFKEATEFLTKAKELNYKDSSLDSMLETCKSKLPVEPKVGQADTSEVTKEVTPPKVRHEWYQTDSHVTVSVMMKKVSPDTVKVDFFPKEFVLTVRQPTGSDFQFSIDPLAWEVVPEESAFSVLTTKIELRLKKKVIGNKWSTLEGTDSEDLVQSMATVQGAKPSYPSSSRKPKNWDALSKEAEQVEKELEGEGDLNSVFQRIYRDADEDTRRAMLKSFTESNGTALSTNWKEVGTKKTETSAPDGMEARDWNKF